MSSKRPIFHRTGHLLLVFVLFLYSCQTWAQKKEISQARTYIKSGKNLDKAEQLMTTLLRDSANRDNKRIYQIWLEAVKGQYDQANERLYLKQKQDTAVFFGYVRRMLSIAETLDSLDMRPDKKGRVKPEYREKHAAMLDQLRGNLFSGGTFFVRKSQWQQAFDYMEAYIDCARQPLFDAFRYDSTDVRRPEAAYWATYSGYMMHDAPLTLRYRQLALQDSARADFTLQFVAEAWRWIGDEEYYLQTLQEGFRRYPMFPYFFPRLVDTYNSKGQYENALAVSDSALVVCDSCQLFLFAKSSALLRLRQYSECIDVSDRIISLNDSLPEPYFNAGTAYVALAEGLDQQKEKKLQKMAYQSALPYMERYRQLMPAEQQKWAPVLYRIYLNLNMGRQFDEIDRLLRQMNM